MVIWRINSNISVTVYYYKTGHDYEANAPLQTTYTTHLAYINDKYSQVKKSTNWRVKLQTEAKLNSWWEANADLLQMAANRHNMQTLYQGLKEVCGLHALCSFKKLYVWVASIVDLGVFWQPGS